MRTRWKGIGAGRRAIDAKVEFACFKGKTCGGGDEDISIKLILVVGLFMHRW